jgi:subtilisin family serine protease
MLAPGAEAATVAVVDSGTDFGHHKLLGNAWTSATDQAGDRIDNDGNGKVDDVNGWNFVDGFGRVFFPEHAKDFHPLVYPLLRVIAHRQAGILDPEEEEFFKKHYDGLPENQKLELRTHLGAFGQYAHGNHVGGIVAALSPEVKILSARVFPDEPPPLYPGEMRLSEAQTSGVVDWIYKLLAVVANGTFHQVGTYLHEKNVDVANYSLGMSLPMIARASLMLRGNQNPTQEEIAAEGRRIYQQFEPEGRKWMAAAPNTLFVIAAGNDGLDNDVLPAFPASIRVDNSISVAAVHGYQKLASFSNFGATSVDVAAPGVAILSAVPSVDRSAELPMSGTSMAAPFVAGVAARVKDANPQLSPREMREILMGTVDQKDWLQGKVVSAGIVNADRAAMAASLTKEMGLANAIAEARTRVPDKAETDHGPRFMGTGERETSSPGLESLARELVF